MYLTKPKGLQWANAGAPQIGPDGSPIVNVTIHITLRQILQQAEQSSMSEAEKAQFTQLMMQLASEKKGGSNVVETVKNLIEIAKNTKELWPSIARFAVEHADEVGRTLQHFPHP